MWEPATGIGPAIFPARNGSPGPICRGCAHSAPQSKQIILTAEQSAHAALAAQDARDLWPDAAVSFIQGGTPAWEKAGLPLETGMPCALCPEDDIWYRPYTDLNASKEAMQGYFDWESGLVDKINADGCVNFRVCCA